jgi:hypothetical protein
MDILTLILRDLRVLRGKFYKMQIPNAMNLSPFGWTLLKPRIHTDKHGCHFDNPCLSVLIRGFGQFFLNHEEREGHEERTFKLLFFVIFVSFVSFVVNFIKCKFLML